MITAKIIKRMTSILRNKSNEKIEYASYGIRYVATMVDLFILYIVLQFTSVILWKFFGKFWAPEEIIQKYKFALDVTSEEQRYMHRHLAAYYSVQLINLGIVFSYCIFFWTKLGATPAKLLIGMRIVTIDADKMKFIGTKRATKRFFAYGLSILPMGLGVLYGFFNKKNQGLHDKISKTVVVTTKTLKNMSVEDPFYIFLEKLANKAQKIFSKIIKKA